LIEVFVLKGENPFWEAGGAGMFLVFKALDEPPLCVPIPIYLFLTKKREQI